MSLVDDRADVHVNDENQSTELTEYEGNYSIINHK